MEAVLWQIDLICKNVNDFIEGYKYTRVENLNDQI